MQVLFIFTGWVRALVSAGLRVIYLKHLSLVDATRELTRKSDNSYMMVGYSYIIVPCI